MKMICIENPHYRIEIDSTHGRITRIHDRKGKFELIAEPRLAKNFQLLLPLPGMEANYILGGEQKLSSFHATESAMELHWTDPLKNERGEFALDVTLRIELV